MATMNDFYKTWMDSQTNLMNSWSGAFQPAQKNGSHSTAAAANPYQAILETQMNVMKQWMDNTMQSAEHARELFSGKSTNDGAAVMNFYEQWMKSQTEMMQRWMESAQKSQTFMSDYMNASTSSLGAMNQVFKLYDSWRNLASTWTVPTNTPWGKMMEMPKVLQDSLKQMFGSSNAYMSVMEFWMPLFRAMQEYPMDMEKIREYMEPARYKDVLDRVFDFASPKAMQDYMTQMQEFTKQFTASAQDSTKQLAQMMEKNSKALAEMMMGNPDHAMKLYNSMMSNYRKAFDMMMDMSGARKDSEAVKLASELVKRSSDYAVKLAEFQYSVYTTSQKAVEKVVEMATETAQKPEIFQSYDAFFKAWTEMNEEAFDHLFTSKEFKKLQKELTDSGVEVRNTFQGMMELFLQDYPVVLRSEVEELQKTVYDLQKKFGAVVTVPTTSTEEPKIKTTTTKTAAKR